MSESANTFYAGPTNGSPASPTFRNIVPSDIATALASPGPIGNTVPSTATFTTLTPQTIYLLNSYTTTSKGFINNQSWVHGAISSSSYNANVIEGSDTVTGGNFSRLAVINTESDGYNGLHQTLLVQNNVLGTPSAGPSATAVALQVSTFCNYNMGGSYYNPVGGLFGGDSLCIVEASSDYIAGVFSWEFDLSVASGCTVARKNALNIVLMPGDGARGTQEDAAISFNNRGTVTWLYGIEFGSPSQSWSFGADSTLVGAVVHEYGTTPSFTASPAFYGVDWRAVLFSPGGAAFASNGFSVDPSGNINSGSITTVSSIAAATTFLSGVEIIDGGAFTTIPQLTVQAPAAGGTTASATISEVAAVNQAQISFGNTGSGYVTGDIVALSGGTGTAPTYKVTATGGNVTELTLASAGSLTALPSFPASFSGGSGTGLTATVGFTATGVGFTQGSGYTPGVIPLIISSDASYYAPKFLATLSTPTPKTLIINGSGGDVRIGTGSVMPLSSTTGFLKFPFTQGVPTAAPSNLDGPSIVWNDTTKTLNIYSPAAGKWYHVSASAGAA